MKRIDIKIAFGCNNMCLFCVQGKKREKHLPKDLGLVRSELKKGFAEGIFSQGFFPQKKGFPIIT